MNSKELKTKLLEKLPVGTDYDISVVGYAVLDIFRHETHKHISDTTDKHNVNILYKGKLLAIVSVLRKKGNYHHSCFRPNGYYDWSINGYKVLVIGEHDTIEERIEEIDTCLNKIENARVIKLNKMTETTKRIMELGLTKEEITDYVNYMGGYINRLEVWDKIEKGE